MKPSTPVFDLKHCGECKKRTVQYKERQVFSSRPEFECGFCGNRFTAGLRGGKWEPLIPIKERIPS